MASQQSQYKVTNAVKLEKTRTSVADKSNPYAEIALINSPPSLLARYLPVDKGLKINNVQKPAPCYSNQDRINKNTSRNKTIITTTDTITDIITNTTTHTTTIANTSMNANTNTIANTNSKVHNRRLGRLLGITCCLIIAIPLAFESFKLLKINVYGARAKGFSGISGLNVSVFLLIASMFIGGTEVSGYDEGDFGYMFLCLGGLALVVEVYFGTIMMLTMDFA